MKLNCSSCLFSVVSDLDVWYMMYMSLCKLLILLCCQINVFKRFRAKRGRGHIPLRTLPLLVTHAHFGSNFFSSRTPSFPDLATGLEHGPEHRPGHRPGHGRFSPFPSLPLVDLDQPNGFSYTYKRITQRRTTNICCAASSNNIAIS